MTVKDLKNLLQDIDEDLQILCLPKNGDGFFPSVACSGMINFEEGYDSQGNLVSDGFGNIRFLGLVDQDAVTKDPQSES